MPKWDATDPAVVKEWQNISAQYALGTSGVVRAVLGASLRPGNVWETAEMPMLKENQRVSQIIAIDPASRVTKVIFTRGKS